MFRCLVCLDIFAAMYYVTNDPSMMLSSEVPSSSPLRVNMSIKRLWTRYSLNLDVCLGLN